MNISSRKGFGLIEVLVGVSIIVVGVIALSSTFSRYVAFAIANQRSVQAAYLIEEGLEAVTFLRDRGWTAHVQPLSTSTTYYLAWDNTHSYWKSTTTPQYVDGEFLRKVNVSDVKRDASSEIATTGTYDPHTKRFNVIVEYRQGNATTTKSFSTYLANLYNN